MKTLLFTLLTTLFMCGSFAQKKSDYQETRKIDKFTGIKSEGSYYIVVEDAAPDGKITLSGNEDQISNISTEVDGKGVLIIKNKKNVFKNFKKQVKITVKGKNLNFVALSGSGDIILQGTQNTTNFAAHLSGSGDIKAEVKADKVTTSISGSGDIKLSGNAQSISVNIAGSGEVDAAHLKSNQADVNIAGSGDAKVWCTDAVTGSVVGSGDIYFKGNPSKSNLKIVGSGDYRSL